MKKQIALDMERIYIAHPEFYGQDMIDRHVKRYEWALSHLSETDTALDACCGSGYGSRMIADKCGDDVLGLDSNIDAIAYAESHYKKRGLSYAVENFAEPGFLARIVNFHYSAIVWVEAIEHFTEAQAERILEAFQKVLLPGGKLIITTPNREESDGGNQFHVREYTPFDLKALVRKYFMITDIKVENKFIYLVARKP